MAGVWLAQRDDLPDNFKHYVTTGSALEETYRHLGYVDVAAPGSDEQDEPGGEAQQDRPPVDPEWAAVEASDAELGGDSTDDR